MASALLMLVSDAARRVDVAQAWRRVCPTGGLLNASSASDAALQAMAHGVAVVVMEDGHADASPALLRHFRRQVPPARILVFGETAHEGRPPVQPWAALTAALQSVVVTMRRREAAQPQVKRIKEGEEGC
ncbi:MAG: hypothetical protein ACK4MG_03685 [Aquabacterium sp.]|uniref:hypothetical protein n=1 Tax=Aquabacterium sp. TaxID=1872578 RepID=UPI0035C6ACA3